MAYTRSVSIIIKGGHTSAREWLLGLKGGFNGSYWKLVHCWPRRA